jgi:hypothetical protein
MNLSIGVNVELTDVLEAYNRGSFQWYFSIVESFNGIFLKIQSFNGTEPIFPLLYEMINGLRKWRLLFSEKKTTTSEFELDVKFGKCINVNSKFEAHYGAYCVRAHRRSMV